MISAAEYFEIALEGIDQATSKNEARSDVKPPQPLDAFGDPIPDVISAEEMHALLHTEGVHPKSNLAKSAVIGRAVIITGQGRHVRVAADAIEEATVSTPSVPKSAIKAPAAEGKSVTLLDRACAAYLGEPLPEATPAKTTQPASAVSGKTLADLFCEVYLDDSDNTRDANGKTLADRGADAWSGA